ncbi:hypothetical protein SPI_07285 [Niveomyces insectorum RCEF 264]|uniref:Uncharacterized protein n=1 Tax=Niveomyces insectorum RCEF 264 TaxID=1081102 RepID=A0A167QGM9_9HYPO|nr:hypothetical protein SPI_07285 [Niveomyces insectorum RCEF 264]
MSQVRANRPAREFKFVGGPSRKRRRNGAPPEPINRPTSDAAAAKQSKRSCVSDSITVTTAAPAPGASSPGSSGASPLSFFRVDGPPGSPSAPLFTGADFAADTSVADLDMAVFSLPNPQPPIPGAAASGLTVDASLVSSATLSTPTDGSSSPPQNGGAPSPATPPTDNTVNGSGDIDGLDGVLDWSGDEIFMNPFFSADHLGNASFLQILESITNDVPPPPVSQTPPVSLLSHASLEPSLGLLNNPSTLSRGSQPNGDDEPHSPPAHDAAAADPIPPASANPPPLPLVSFDNNKQPYVSADGLLLATSPRMFAQPSNLHDTISRIFFQYDQEFCILPLTCDFAANPFRYNLATMQHSSLLRQCILALSYKHVNHDTGACTNEATAYKRRATQMLQDTMPPDGRAGPDASLLDASIVLVTLDCATSALGPWPSHLRRAKRILQSTPANRFTAQRRAQIGLLAWFDVTRALTSRNGCILPESLILSIFDATADGAAALDFYAISGCPRALFACMVRLAAYARELQSTSGMACVRFNMAPVLEIQRRIAAWQAPAFGNPVATADDLLNVMQGGLPEQSVGDSNQARKSNNNNNNNNNSEQPLDDRLDLYHCAEAWRYALLLYIERVFKWQDAVWQAAREARLRTQREQAWVREEYGEPVPPTTRPTETEPLSGAAEARPLWQFLARRTLNHVASCRRSTFVQKQLMLPVFLAGAEVREESLRNDARDYCAWWGAKTRYNMFLTAGDLLEDVWQRDDNVWWGDVFDQRAMKGETEYLLG